MTLLLDAYDTSKETVELRKARENCSVATSLVEIVDNETQTILAITVGSNDQEVMHKIVRLWSNAENRYVPPGKQPQKVGVDIVDNYRLMCDALLELNSPEVYRRADRESKEGYIIDPAALQTIIDAAKQESFANVRLAGCVSSYLATEKDAKGNVLCKGELIYADVNIEFNRNPWIPPVPVEQSKSISCIKKPFFSFKNIIKNIFRAKV